MLDNLNSLTQEDNKFNISLTSYEGPIDLLLDLARRQKVNLSDISILTLAEQYIKFINNYSKLHLEIAADYLVMAAWLTYLKSRLLLPVDEKKDEHSTEDIEEAVRFQLLRLEAMQNASKNMYSLPLINRDVFYGGSNEGIKTKYNIVYTSSLFDLLKSYSNIIKKEEIISTLTISSTDLHSVDEAIKRLKNMFNILTEWTNFMSLIPKFGLNTVINKSNITSNLVASLELAKNGFIELKQKGTFGHIYVKTRSL